MKYIATGLSSLFLGLTIACGGGSSSPEPEDDNTTPPPPPAFSFKALQENNCGQVSPLEGVEFLIYNESPNSNPSTGYTRLTSDAEGKIELDVEESSLVSFTLNATDANNNIRSYSFTELKADDYNMIVLSSGDAFTNDSCTCDSFELEGTVSGDNYIAEIRSAGLEAGLNINGGYYSTSGNTIDFTDSQLCNDDFSAQPLIATAELEGYDDRVIYGVDSQPSIDTAGPNSILLDQVSLSASKPDIGTAYTLTHSLYFNEQSYLYGSHSASENTYFPFSDLMPDYHFFQKYVEIQGTFNNGTIAEIYATRQRASRQQSSNAESMGDMATGSYIDVNVADDTGLVTWQTDSTTPFNMALVSRIYVSGSQTIRHYIYTSVGTSVQIPPNTADIESMMADGELRLSYLALLVNDVNSDFSSYINARRFVDTNGNSFGRVSEKSIYSYYSPITQLNNQKSTDNKAQIRDMIRQEVDL
ncbi:hypothetical protein [Aliikangiella sp. G2MR2-5]|uniref:hypothetical protein n=1 Tax=Aliikangiella sp. G2MR2-5 TaxID=2788943 RepID=UPI0018AA653D|nr:hypothetical protein [Aliikangiella sp. G2MR2-5]